MLVHNIRTAGTRVLVGAVAAAAVAVPLYASLSSTDTTTQAGPRCLAWFGNKEDGQCLGYSNGGGATIGTPAIGFGGNGLEFTTGPLFPGHHDQSGHRLAVLARRLPSRRLLRLEYLRAAVDRRQRHHRRVR